MKIQNWLMYLYTKIYMGFETEDVKGTVLWGVKRTVPLPQMNDENIAQIDALAEEILK